MHNIIISFGNSCVNKTPLKGKKTPSTPEVAQKLKFYYRTKNKWGESHIDFCMECVTMRLGGDILKIQKKLSKLP